MVNYNLFKSKNKNLRKLIIFILFLCIITVVLVWINQTFWKTSSVDCTYLDPIITDVLAFIAAIFLIVDGFWRILENPSSLFKRQLTRIVRILFGCAIVTIHILQVMHK